MCRVVLSQIKKDERMSIFGNIMTKIFHAAESVVSPTAVVSGADTEPATPTSSAETSATAVTQPQSAPSAPAAAAQPVDVEAVLTGMASQKNGGGNWKTSIVDLLKLLDLDSSLASRKQLASELDVHVGADGTAEENIALHKAVMQKLAENGGKVPENLKG